ncbi:MAG: hypothetical protein ACKO2L_08380 [Planctomycetaceae bacterium]
MKRILFAVPFRPLAVLHASERGKPGIATQNTLVIFAGTGAGVCKPEIERLAQTAAINAGLKVNADVRGGRRDVWDERPPLTCRSGFPAL